MSTLILTLTIRPERETEKEGGKSQTPPATTRKVVEQTIVLHSDNTAESTINLMIGNQESSFTLIIKQLNFQKQLYQPCKIQAVLQLDKGDYQEAIPHDTLFATFLEAVVDLQWKKDNDTASISIASNYYVHEVTPRYYRNGTLEINLRIFSRDKKLTLDRFCRTYTAKKLLRDLVLQKEPQNEETGKQDATTTSQTADAGWVNKYNELINNAAVQVATDTHLTFLHYTRTNAENKSETNEYIQPYLVQYNESYYDLIARVANRCGEFLYFEDGKLHLGLPSNNRRNAQKTITQYDSVSFQDLATGITEVKDHYYDGTNPAGTYTQDNYAYNTEIPLDDYITIFQQDSFSNFTDEWWGNWGTQILNMISSVLNSTSLSDTLVNWGIAQGTSLIKTPSAVKAKNNSMNEAHITSMPEDQKRPIGSGENTQSNSSLYEASPFSTLLKKADTPYKFQENLNTFFYEFVKRAEKDVSKQAVVVDLGTGYADLKLGELVSLANFTDQTYVVIKLEGQNQITNSETISHFQATLLPIYTYTETTETAKEGKPLQLVIPPYHIVSQIRNSGPQRALVADNSDPEGLGRVRIRYPWQTANSDASPWIRMATPFATNGGGMYFAPSTGDEVLVDYDNGNIERPYVVGALFNGKATAPGNGTRVISSANGHSIVLKDAKSGSGFFSGLWGGMTLLETAIPGISNAFKGAKDLGGGITLTDKYGIYSISMSSEGRKVSISSPFGNVNINAFTGISLSAPNGDIKITGKNVTIKASNNLTITSGENIPDSNTQMLKMAPEEVSRRRKLKEHSASLFFSDMGASIKETTSNLKPELKKSLEKLWDFAKYDSASFATSKLFESVAASYVDLSLLRNIMEAILRPTAGTMLIKSWRFLRLEAGRGTTRIPNNAYTTSGLQRVLNDNHSKMKVTYETIMALSNMVDNWISSILTKHRKAYIARKDLTKLLKDYTLTKKEDQGDRSDADIKKYIDDLIKDALTSTFVTSSHKGDFIFKEIGTGENKIPLPKEIQEFVANCATYLRKTVAEHRKLIEDYTQSLSGYQINSLLRKSLVKGAKSVTGNQQIEFKLDAFKSVTDGTETYEQEPMEVAPFMAQQQEWIQKTKRKLIFRYIINYSNLASAKEITINEENLITGNGWEGFVNLLHERGKDDPSNKDNDLLNKTLMSAISTATDSLLDLIAFPDWSKSKDLWGPESEGEILFSDKSGHTLNFERGHLNHTVNSDRADDYLLRIKLKLKSI